MKFLLFLFFGLFIVLAAKAQQVKVLEQGSKYPISGVSIYNSEKSIFVTSDLDGTASLDDFADDEFIYFQNLLYVTKSLTKDQIVANNNVVYLQVKVENLDEIVISASKFEQDKREIPQKITNISASDIKLANPQTSADLLESSGNVFIQKSQLGGGSPIIRGFSTNRLLITVDGVRMNNAIFRGGNLQNVLSVDPFSVQQTEVILGAGSIVYGSDAIGGVMSFYTKKPVMAYLDSTLVNVGGALRYASANNEKTANAQINIGRNRWSFLSNISYSNFDDLRMGSNGPDEYLRPEFVIRRGQEDVVVQNDDPLVQKPTGYKQLNLMQKVRYVPKDDWSFDLGLFYTTTSDFPRYDRLIRYRDDQLRSAEWDYGPQRWFMGNFQLTKLSSSSNLYDKIQTTFAYQNFQESRFDRDFNSDIRNTREEAVDALSANFDFEKSLSPKLNLFYGAEYVYNLITSSGEELNINSQEKSNTVSRYPNGSTWQSIAAYTSIKYKSSEKFVLQTGLRYNQIIAKSDFTENNEFLNLPFNDAEVNAGALTGTAGFSYNPTKMLQLRTNLSTAFRAPNIDDIGKVFDSEPGSVVVPNPNIKPEYAYGADVGVRLNLENKLIFDSSVFYTFLDDALVRRNFTLNGESQIEYDGELSDVQAIQNASKANIYGLEIGLKYRFTEALSLTSQYNIIRGEEEENGNKVPVRHVAPDFGNTHLIWQKDNLKLDAFLVYNAELTFNELALSERPKDFIYALDENGNPFSPSWYTLNIRTSYNFNEDLTAVLALENITDQRYRPYSSGISAPGRNLILSLNYAL